MPSLIPYAYGQRVTEETVSNLPEYGVGASILRLQTRSNNGYDTFFGNRTGTDYNEKTTYIGASNGANDALVWQKLIGDYIAPDFATDYAFSQFSKFGVIGDSLARGSVYPDPDTSQVYRINRYMWPNIVANKLGSTPYKYSAGGMTAQDFINGYSDNGNNANSVSLDAMLDGTDNLPCYIIGLGVNDTIDGNIDQVNPGTLGTRPTNGTFYQAYSYIINSILNHYDNDVYIFCLGVPYYGSVASTQNRNTAIGAIANKFNEANFKCYFVDFSEWAYYYQNDNYLAYWNHGHFTGAGYYLNAQITCRALGRTMAAHKEDFIAADFMTNNNTW